jgi:hypothetical protein
VLRSEQFVALRQKLGHVVREEMRYMGRGGGGHALGGGLAVEEEEEEKEAGLGVTGREDIVRESGGDMEEMILHLLMPAPGHVRVRPSRCCPLKSSRFNLSLHPPFFLPLSPFPSRPPARLPLSISPSLHPSLSLSMRV